VAEEREGRAGGRNESAWFAPSIAEGAPDVVSRFDRDLRYLYINQTVEGYTGIPREAFLGRTYREVGFPEENCALWDAAILRTLATGNTTVVEFALEKPGLGTRHCEGYSIAERAADGTVASVLTITRDVTDRVRADRRMREADERLRLAVESAAIGTWDFEPRTGALTADARCRELFGIEDADAAPLTLAHFRAGLHPDDRAAVDAATARALDPDAGGDGDLDVKYRSKDGTGGERWIRLKGRALFDAPGRLAVRLIGTALDVTAEKRAEAERAAHAAVLAESEARLRQALSAARMGMWDWDVATGKLTWAGHLEEIHGMAPGTFDGRFETFAGLIHPDDRPYVLARIARALEEGGHYNVELRVTYPDGSIHWIAGDGRAERDPRTGKTVRMIGMGWDITDVKRAQEESRRRAEEERWRAEREALLNRIGETLRGAGVAQRDPARAREAAEREVARALRADRCRFLEFGGGGAADEEARAETATVDPRALFCGPGGVLRADDLASADAADATRSALAPLGLHGAALGVALFDDGGAPVAALVAGMARRAREWTADELDLVRAVATLAREASEDARVRRREHDIAERLQAALQPTLPDSVPGLEVDAHYQPALSEATIGGDFYDVFALDGGRAAALVVADLSGKGLAAAAQVATLRHMLRTLLYLRGATLDGAITSLDRLIGAHNLLQGFATVFVGTYDAERRTLTYVNAGQEPGLLRRAASGAVEELWPTGPVLAGFPGAPPYEERTLTLEPGDVLALFTDGLTEAGPSRARMLGVPGVSGIFRESASDPAATSSQIAARMMGGVEGRATPGGIRDDVCLLVARVPEHSHPENSHPAR